MFSNIGFLKSLAELKIDPKVSSFQVSVLIILIMRTDYVLLVKGRMYKSCNSPMISIDVEAISPQPWKGLIFLL